MKKYHADSPHGSRTAKPWQDLLGNERLHKKQGEGAGENGTGENQIGGNHGARKGESGCDYTVDFSSKDSLHNLNSAGFLPEASPV
jgi:hypothetical protein